MLIFPEKMLKQMNNIKIILTFALVLVSSLSWFPWQIIVKVIALLAVQTFCIVRALTSTMNLETINSSLVIKPEAFARINSFATGDTYMRQLFHCLI